MLFVKIKQIKSFQVKKWGLLHPQIILCLHKLGKVQKVLSATFGYFEIYMCIKGVCAIPYDTYCKCRKSQRSIYGRSHSLWEHWRSNMVFTTYQDSF